MITNRDLYKFNFEIHGINTRHGTYLFLFRGSLQDYKIHMDMEIVIFA